MVCVVSFNNTGILFCPGPLYPLCVMCIDPYSDYMWSLHCLLVLEPYKYAGYPMLIKTIRMETDDDSLFSKSAPLLSAASELCYHTVNCSALNAEELRREKGIEVGLICLL